MTILKGFIAATVVGAFMGVIVGLAYGLSMQDFAGAVGMFFGMIVWAYLVTALIGLIVFFIDWMYRD